MRDHPYTEVWREVVDFPDYLVSNFGNVKHVRGSLLKVRIAREYHEVTLYCGKTKKTKRVHTLVAESFLGPKPSADHHAAHLNDKRFDNRLINIVWATPAENAVHRDINGHTLRGEKIGNSKLTRDQVESIKREFVSTSLRKTNALALAKKHGVSSSTILSIMKGKVWVEGCRRTSTVSINVQPIAKESAEDVLREYANMEWVEGSRMGELAKRAKRVLESK